MSKRGLRALIMVVAVLFLGGVVGLSFLGQSSLWQPRKLGPEKSARPGQPGLPPAAALLQRLRPLGITLHGQVQAAQIQEVTSPADGKVVALVAPEGQPVTAGQLILQLDVPQLREQIAAAQARLSHLQALQQQGVAPQLRARVQAAGLAVQEAQGNVQQMQSELDVFVKQNPEAATVGDTYQRAADDYKTASVAFGKIQREFNEAQRVAGAAGKPPPGFLELTQKFTQAQERERGARLLLDQAQQARLRLRQELVKLEKLRRRVARAKQSAQDVTVRQQHLQQLPEVLMMTQGQQQIQQATVALQQLQAQSGHLTINAPAAGTLREVAVRPGQSVKSGQVLARVQIAAAARLVFQASLVDSQRLRVGRYARVESANNGSFDASISEIIPQKSEAQVVVVAVRSAQLPAPDTALTARF